MMGMQIKKVIRNVLVVCMLCLLIGCRNKEKDISTKDVANIKKDTEEVKNVENVKEEISTQDGVVKDIKKESTDTRVNHKEENELVFDKELYKHFLNIDYSKEYKGFGMGNPLITQSYGADPYAMVYKDRIYVYMTHDEYMYDKDGKIGTNTYATIKSLRCISSDDLVNWTDHGTIYVGGIEGVTTWANNSWAPAAAWKEIDGEDKFFLYFANSASSIGVLEADNPYGPFRDPIGKPIITRETPNCSDVTWLFDPAVLMDDDGQAYIYFGGGVPVGKEAMPNTARVIKLGDDMVTTVGSAVMIEAPYVFEDSGINKIGDTYYYSYCSNWASREGSIAEIIPNIAEIIYMTSKDPMGPWEYKGSILENPGKYFGSWGNNHHCITEFQGSYYMFYHTQVLQDSIGVTGGYRSTHVNKLEVNEDGSLRRVIPDKYGIKQLKHFNPYQETKAVTMSNQGGISIYTHKKTSFKEAALISLSDIDNGDWIEVRGVDFGKEGPSTLTLEYSCEGEGGAIRVSLDKLGENVIGYAKIEPTKSKDSFQKITIEVNPITDVHNLYFEFVGSGYLFHSWSFAK